MTILNRQVICGTNPRMLRLSKKKYRKECSVKIKPLNNGTHPNKRPRSCSIRQNKITTKLAMNYQARTDLGLQRQLDKFLWPFTPTQIERTNK